MKIALRIMVGACVVGLSGCMTLQSWFPDKEKDYQFTTELPPLIIPPELVQRPVITPLSTPSIAIEMPIAKTKTKEVSVTKKTESKIALLAESPTKPKTESPPPANAETDIARDEIQVSLIHESIPTLNLNIPSARSWRMINKALSRSNIEVSQRNQEQGEIHIQFTEAKTKVESEKSLWDNAVSIFNPFTEPEQSYLLKFNETNQKTTVVVLNPALQTLSNGDDNKILSLLFEAIKADLSK